jgi:hypothetical protein
LISVIASEAKQSIALQKKKEWIASSQELLAMTWMARCHTMLSSPAKAGDPVRRGFSVLSSTSLEYWIVRRSLSSGGHSADPVADNDTGYAFTIPRRDAPEVCR